MTAWLHDKMSVRPAFLADLIIVSILVDLIRPSPIAERRFSRPGVAVKMYSSVLACRLSSAKKVL